MSERTPLTILRELAEIAAGRRHTDSMFYNRSDNRLEENAKLVGRLIENLPPEDREILKDIKSEDIAKAYHILLGRWPKEVARRQRGPVTLSKRKDNED